MKRHVALLSVCMFGCDERGVDFSTDAPVRETGDAAPEDDIQKAERKDGQLDVAVLIDTTSYPALPGDVSPELEAFRELMKELLGTSVNYLYTPSLLSRQDGETDLEYVRRFFEHASVPYPEYLILFSYGEGNWARIYGGYFGGSGGNVAVDPPYCNEFRTNGNESRMIIGVVDLMHLYARCGYNDDLEHVSDVSFGGECRNQPGTPCVWNGEYYVCETFQDEPFTDLSLFHASVMVHELMHAWGPSHVCTSECEVELGTGCVSDETVFRIANFLNTNPCNVSGFLNSFTACDNESE